MYLNTHKPELIQIKIGKMNINDEEMTIVCNRINPNVEDLNIGT